MAMDIVWFGLDTTWQLGIHPSIVAQTSGGNPMGEGVSFSYIWGGSKTTIWSLFSVYTLVVFHYPFCGYIHLQHQAFKISSVMVIQLIVIVQ